MYSTMTKTPATGQFLFNDALINETVNKTNHETRPAGNDFDNVINMVKPGKNGRANAINGISCGRMVCGRTEPRFNA